MAQNGKIRSNLAGNLSVARQVFWRPTIGLSGFLHHLLPSKRNDLALMSAQCQYRLPEEKQKDSSWIAMTTIWTGFCRTSSK